MQVRQARFLGSMAMLMLVSSAQAQAPGGVEVICDVDRNAFRADAADQTQVCFRLWTSQLGGAPVGGTRCVPLAGLTVVRMKTESFGEQRARSFVRVATVIGSDQDPILPPEGPEAWLEMEVGPQVLGCDLDSGAPRRRRVQSTLFARRSDQIQSGQGAPVPTGSIVPFAGSVAPGGWLLCDGTPVARTAYSALFAVLGTAYGAGDGSSTFNLPDLRGRMPAGRGVNGDVDALGDSDGLGVTSRTPKHSHTVDSHTHTLPNHQHSVAIWSKAEEFHSWFSDCSRRYPKANYDCFGHGHGVVGNTEGVVVPPSTPWPETGPSSAGTSPQAPSYLTVNYIIRY